MTEDKLAKLEGLQRADFDAVATWQRNSRLLQGAVLAIAIVGIPLPEAFQLPFALAQLFIAGAVAWTWWRARKVRSGAERIRRATLVGNSFGLEYSEQAYLSLLELAASGEEAGRQREDQAYHASTQSAGLARFCENLSENAFFSSDIAQHAGQRSLTLFFLFVGVSVLAIACAGYLGPDGATDIIGRGVSAALVAAMSVDFLGSTLAYRAGAADLRLLRERLDRGRITWADAMVLLGDYNSAVEGMPVLPGDIYRSRVKILDSQWREARARRHSG